MQFLTRDALAAKVKAKIDGDAGALSGVRLARVFGRREAPATDEAMAKVRAALGGDGVVGRVVPFIISTPQRAADDHTLDPMGCDSVEYERVPHVFWQHEYSGWRAMPSRAAARIGASVIEKSKDAVTASCAFFTRELSEHLDGGFSYAIGEIAAAQGHRASVSFDVVEAAVAPEEVRKMAPWALDVSVWRMGEWSLVNFGSDSDAISGGRAAGVDVGPIAEQLSRFLDDVVAVTGAHRVELERLWSAAADPGRARIFVPSITGADLAAAMDAAARAALAR